MASFNTGNEKALEKERQWKLNVQNEIRARLDRGVDVSVDELMKVQSKREPAPPAPQPQHDERH